MKTSSIVLGVIGAVTVAGIAFAVVPALRGPVNRARITANEKLNDEYVVDNMKAKYIELHESKQKLTENINKLTVEMRVADKKLTYANEQMTAAKNKLVGIGTSDMVAFNTAKEAYEVSKVNVENLTIMRNSYENSIVKLNDALNQVNAQMLKAKTNVATLESKKELVDSLKKVNSTIESLTGVSGDDLSISVEKLNEDAIRESIKLEALSEPKSVVTDKEAAQAYLDSIK